MNKEEFFSKLVSESENKDILAEMKMQSPPLVLFGGGSMSYSIRKILKKENIKIDVCWIDNCDEDEFLDDIPIMNLEDIKRKYEKVNIIFGHSKYEMADKIIRENPFINQCYCLVNVCYGQWKGLTYNFVKEHISEYFNTYELLEDKESRECMLAYLNCKLSENFRFLLPVCEEKATYFNNPFFKLDDKEEYVDIGAYDGDTIREYLDCVKTYSHIYAIEPEEDSFCKLEKYVKDVELENIELYKCGCWDEETVLKFNLDEESSSIGIEGTQELEVHTLDNLLRNRKITIIKINFLNGVVETLRGGADILKRQKPKLTITVGFDEWGIINIPKVIKEINSEYKISLRYAAAMPARLILFAY